MHQVLKRPALALCEKCGKPSLPHAVCQNCGYYKGREVIDVMKKLTKKERKAKEREMAIKEKEAGKGPAKEGGLSWEELSKK